MTKGVLKIVLNNGDVTTSNLKSGEIPACNSYPRLAGSINKLEIFEDPPSI
jgi:hypothetical protein